MSITIYQLVIPGYIRTLNNLSHLLDKGAEHAAANKIEESALLDARLFPDMFPFARQIRMVTDMTRLAAALLTGREAPKFDSNETTFADLKKRINGSIDYLKSFTEADFADAATREVRLPWAADKVYPGEVFTLQHSIPNVYFHLTTAYNLLRHNGVPVGKTDFLGTIG